jgi:uncharacterized protein (TIGR00375 family)
MRLISDLHIHSRFSRATSPQMELPCLVQWAKKKGIDLLGTGDFTHPQWFSHLEEHLVPQGNGLYRYEGVWFLPTAEVAVIWSQDGEVHKVHLILLAPSLEAVAKINEALRRIGNLAADGRPIFGLSAKRLVEIIWDVEPAVEVIPAHAWTPWFSVFGSRSGFDSLEACFGKHVERIFAIETGLSSDPAMNWRVSALDELALISCSDAHSPSRLGREATLFDLAEPSYAGLINALKTRDQKRFLGTLEFYPEEGKYHYDGHRTCGVALSPTEAMAKQNLCPVCGRPLTLGVLHRVEELADRAEGGGPPHRVPYRCLVPLEEIIAQALGVQPGTKTVESEYERLITHFGNEFRILTELSEEALARRTPARILDGIMKAQGGDLHIEPGYDGVYGKISIPFSEEKATEQLSLL